MKKIIPLVLALTVSGVCCIVAACFCHYYYSLHQNTATRLETWISSLDMRLAKLEAHKPRELRPVHVWGIISSTDRAPDEHMQFYLSSEKRPDGFFDITETKSGSVVRPEIRLPVGSTTNSECEIQLGRQFGIVADAWLSHAVPYQDLAAFDEFRVYCPAKTNTIRLIARLRQDTSVQMRFDLVLLCER